MNKLISIITPLYNSERFIESTIKSVISQSYKNWEMIVVDDCSTDKGADRVNKYSQKDHRIKLIRLPQNSGGALARNKAIEEAKGKYIAFLDSDDLWHPEKLEKQVKFMEENNYDFTYTWYEKMDEDGNLINEIVKSKDKMDYSELLKSNQIGCLTAIYNQKKLGKIYMPLIKKRQDYALWLQVLKKTKYGYCLKENLAQYRLVNGSVSSNKINLIKFNWKLFYEIEKLGLIKSSYYLMWNIFTKLFLKR
ncbi:glycosyltransferase family 2 protein [uncultured Ilyobacter sp.]|uniref:glycosyltransferase family 2 protein n=1 Tax=uncultured Ilyobacter sp. TaxID=544433 RepID=UPI0029F4CDD7|nr:glycosyltransferase family 2 protein [uncultured Ilyobacter sp.]